MNNPTLRRLVLMIVIFLVIPTTITACQTNISDDRALPPLAKSSSRSTFTPAATSPSPGIDISTTTPAATAEDQPTATPGTRAPQLSFPTPDKPLPVSWRPPVYPIPWAPNPQDHFYFMRPIAAATIKRPNSNYGYGDVYFENIVHTGIDIPGDIGTPVLAAAEGKVIWTGYGYYRGGSNILDDPYGKAVAVQHTFGYQNQPLYTVYAHLDEITTRIGSYVQAGDQLGTMGETGHATGPHLHFEVRLGEDSYFATRNPGLWLAPPQGWGLLVGQIRNYDGRLLELQPIYVHSQLDPELQNTEKDQIWIARSYKNEAINSDPYYQENFLVPDLPAGLYRVNIPMTNIGLVFSRTIEIRPGQVTYLEFELWEGFTTGPPPTEPVKFTPAP